jgi:hypothetical protein
MLVARQILDALPQPIPRTQNFGSPVHAGREVTRSSACGPSDGGGRGRRAPAGCASARGSRGSSCDGGCWAETFASRLSPTSDAPPERSRSLAGSIPGRTARERRGLARRSSGGRRWRRTNRLAERVGFEPTDRVNDQRFSRPPHSTALAPLLASRIRGLAPRPCGVAASAARVDWTRAGVGFASRAPDCKSGACRPEAQPRRQAASAASGLAERVGFEPTVGFPLHTLSRRAPSATRSPLRGGAATGSAHAPVTPCRSAAKNPFSIAAHSSLNTPLATSIRWFRRGSCTRFPSEPQKPALGSSVANTRRRTRL